MSFSFYSDILNSFSNKRVIFPLEQKLGNVLVLLAKLLSKSKPEDQVTSRGFSYRKPSSELQIASLIPIPSFSAALVESLKIVCNLLV